MFDRTGRDAIGRLGAGSRGRSKTARRLGVEPLEGRAMMTASIAPIAPISVPQNLGYQVPLIGGTTHAQTYTVASDNPGVKASIARGQFLTIGVSHPSSGAGDVAVTGTMTFQLFEDLTPNTARMIESLVTGTATNLASGVSIGSNYYVGKTFHRVAPGFPGPNDYIVQGGSLNGNGTGSVFAAPFDDEFVQSLAFTGSGQLAMANSGRDTNDSQFFVTTGSPRFLDHIHTIFGQIVGGQDILQQLTQVTRVADSSGSVTQPSSPITITSATLSAASPSGVVHLDTAGTAPGTTANVVVTATDVTDGTTASQSFAVNVTALPASAQERPFLGPVDTNQALGSGQVYTFQLTGIAPQPGSQLTYTVQGGTTTSTTNGTTTTTFTPVSNATASVSATGLVTVTPTAGFAGTINLLVGVRDQINRAGAGAAADTPSNFDTNRITLTVNASATPVATRPIALPVSVTATTVGSTAIQLQGSNPNATETQPLTYTLTAQPTNGTVSNFDATTGRLTYTPNAGFIGADTLQYTVTSPTSNLTSFASTVSISVTRANTGAVRFIANDGSNSTAVPGILVVTPRPRTDGGIDTVNVTQVDGNVQVTVNGIIDIIQPSTANVDRIVVYGSKAQTKRITIDPSVTALATIDGGRAGKAVIRAGGGPTRAHGWYGQNTLIQGSSNNYQLGRKGSVTFKKGSGTSDVLFASDKSTNPPTGKFFAFNAAGQLVETSSPYGRARATAQAKAARRK